MLANAGHFDVEIDLAGAARGCAGERRRCGRCRAVRPRDGRRLHLLAGGPRRQPRRGRGPPGRGDGHVVRQPGAGGRAPRARSRQARAGRASTVPEAIDARSRGSSSRRSASRSTRSRPSSRRTCDWERARRRSGRYDSASLRRVARPGCAPPRRTTAIARRDRSGGRSSRTSASSDGRATCRTPAATPRELPRALASVGHPPSRCRDDDRGAATAAGDLDLADVIASDRGPLRRVAAAARRS